MTKAKTIPLYDMDDEVLIKESNVKGKICGVRKQGSRVLYLVKNAWVAEVEIEKIISTEKKTPSFFIPETASVLFAYVNMRTQKVDHYKYEWAGNQFARRAPEFDIAKRS